jgi:hypothetical protein
MLELTTRFLFVRGKTIKPTMSAFATTVLQLALTLLLSVQTNTTATDAQRQQAITVATQAIQLAEQVMASSARTSQSTAPTYSLSPSSGPVGTLITLSGTFTTCGSSTPAGECTEDRFNQPVFFQNGSVVATTLAVSNSEPQTYQVPSTLVPGVYQFGMQNCLGQGCTNYSLAQFTVTSN